MSPVRNFVIANGRAGGGAAGKLAHLATIGLQATCQLVRATAACVVEIESESGGSALPDIGNILMGKAKYRVAVCGVNRSGTGVGKLVGAVSAARSPGNSGTADGRDLRACSAIVQSYQACTNRAEPASTRGYRFPLVRQLAVTVNVPGVGCGELANRTDSSVDGSSPVRFVPCPAPLYVLFPRGGGTPSMIVRATTLNRL